MPVAAASRAPFTAADWTAWTTGVRVAVTDPDALAPARATVRALMDRVDAAASRFRPDSELVRLGAAGGRAVPVSPLLRELLTVALRAARLTDGLVDPTVGPALSALGYDRSIEALPADAPAVVRGCPAPGWRAVELDTSAGTVRLPAGAALDLGATAKAWTADAAATAVHRETGCGALVAIGGDLAAAGPPPPDGWVVRIADDHAAPGDAGPRVCVRDGGLATSSVTVRTWRRGGRRLHHVVDPATGLPTRTPWRSASVAAASCLDANTASTAALLLGAGAPAWLAARRLPARLVAPDGGVVTVAGWPEEAPA